MERREEDEDTKAIAQSEDQEEQDYDDEEKREDDDDDDDDEEEEEEGAAADKRDDEDKDVSDKDAAEVKEKKKKIKNVFQDRKCVPGIIYLGHIPPRFRPKHLRNLLSVYGEIGRIFLQPEDRQVRKRKKKAGLRRCDFTEGWVEFRDKRVAKKVAASLHNTPMGTRKRQRFSSDLWCMKYLHRFQWIHLSERLAYEQTVLNQRLRTEVSQAKRETNFYLNNVEKSAHLDKLRKKRQRDGEQVEEKTWDFTQRQTEEEIQMKKKKKDSVSQKHLDKARLMEQKSQSNVSLLAKIFNSKPSQ
ncbi:activator of basal transcription 1 isoform X2 [Oreochromis niloticus]|uniref:Activator of basal transcription 1 n=2 Tax=Oreochromis niloticus TaxID=8128 RepID=I3IWF5_ORENI|nr:activator of basal transcription 1 isoform X2 [Oreochromis niloticus]XP_019205432.1 activator of basal transcription 1 isoform X2 [Oreochromis niloticus]